MPHATAIFNGQVIAEADSFETVEGNVYFPRSSIRAKDALSEATLTTVCPWKGTASYYNINVNGKEAKDAAWYYPDTVTERAEKIKDHVAFYKTKVDVKVE